MEERELERHFDHRMMGSAHAFVSGMEEKKWMNIGAERNVQHMETSQPETEWSLGIQRAETRLACAGCTAHYAAAADAPRNSDLDKSTPYFHPGLLHFQQDEK